MRAGFAKEDISAWEPGMTLMGWGVPEQQAEGVELPLYSRAAVFQDEAGRRVAYVVVDLMAVSQGVWLTVCDALTTDYPDLGLGIHNVAIVATHTHSGPSGFGHHFWLNLSTPGFSRSVHDRIVDGVIQSIVSASQSMADVTLSIGDTDIPQEAKVAFNRSWFAFSRNQDVAPVPFERRDEAVDRTLTLVTAETNDGRLDLMSWFGLHGTCIHKEQRKLHPDHKGLAAQTLEHHHGVALMAQACCGDVSPNHRHDSSRGHTVGTSTSDHTNAELAASAQVDAIRRLQRDGLQVMSGCVEVVSRVIDFECAPVDPSFSPDHHTRTTSPARLGLSMAEGTAEGPGPLHAVRQLNRASTRVRAGLHGAWSRLTRRPPNHDPKISLLELSRGDKTRLAGVVPVRWLPPVDPIVTWIRDHIRRGTAGSGSWVPTKLPIQLVRVGSLVLCTLPFEVTTVAGRRLRETLRSRLPDDITHIVISSYANAYCGYLTTFEEYQVQHYEAGYNLFGPFALAAARTAVAELAEQIGHGSVFQGTAPPRVDQAQLHALAFTDPWGA
jgi:neutral ceramidase